MEYLEQTNLSERDLNHIIEKYQGKSGYLLLSLKAAQQTNSHNYLPLASLKFIADKFQITFDEILKFVKSIDTFNLEPQGLHTVVICCGNNCIARKSKALLDEVAPTLGYPFVEIPKETSYTTSDLKYTIKSLNCIGDCDHSPLITVDDVIYNKVNYYKLTKILKQLQK